MLGGIAGDLAPALGGSRQRVAVGRLRRLAETFGVEAGTGAGTAQPCRKEPSESATGRHGRASMQRRAFAPLAAGLQLWSAGAARAASLPQPAGPVILRVSGRIRETNAEGGVARFDRP